MRTTKWTEFLKWAASTKRPPCMIEIDKWAQFVAMLDVWFANPAALGDDETIAPRRDIVHKAQMLAKDLSAIGSQPPSRIVPNRDGGIVLEWRNDRRVVTFEIEFDGRMNNYTWEKNADEK
jgi:hypothetical protein